VAPLVRYAGGADDRAASTMFDAKTEAGVLCLSTS
jgi:hypothetical protein